MKHKWLVALLVSILSIVIIGCSSKMEKASYTGLINQSAVNLMKKNNTIWEDKLYYTDREGHLYENDLSGKNEMRLY